MSTVREVKLEMLFSGRLLLSNANGDHFERDRNTDWHTENSPCRIADPVYKLRNSRTDDPIFIRFLFLCRYVIWPDFSLCLIQIGLVVSML